MLEDPGPHAARGPDHPGQGGRGVAGALAAGAPVAVSVHRVGIPVGVADPHRPALAQLRRAHAPTEVGLEPGHRRERPDAVGAEVEPARGALEGPHVELRHLVPNRLGRRADQLLPLRHQRQLAERPAADAAVAGRPLEHVCDVPVGVVVGEDRALGVRGHAAGAQVARRGEDRVLRVGGVADAVAVGVHAVGRPGRGHELHPADRAGGRGPLVDAEAGLDLVDRGEDRGAGRSQPVLLRGGLVDRDQEGGHARRAAHRERGQRHLGAVGHRRVVGLLLGARAPGRDAARAIGSLSLRRLRARLGRRLRVGLGRGLRPRAAGGGAGTSCWPAAGSAGVVAVAGGGSGVVCAVAPCAAMAAATRAAAIVLRKRPISPGPG